MGKSSKKSKSTPYRRPPSKYYISNGDKPGCFHSTGISPRVHDEKDIWRYYIAEHQCLHFKGTGHINNYYILGRYLTAEGDVVRNKKTLKKAVDEGRMIVDVDFVVSNQYKAIGLARKKFYPGEVSAPVPIGVTTDLSF